MPTAEELLAMLRRGGSIASAGDCTDAEVEHARRCYRLHVDGAGNGYVYRPATRTVAGLRPWRRETAAQDHQGVERRA